MTATEAIAAVRAGERVTCEFSMHPEPLAWCPVNCSWRVLFCNSDYDVVECLNCVRQAIAKCDFDEEYS